MSSGPWRYGRRRARTGPRRGIQTGCRPSTHGDKGTKQLLAAYDLGQDKMYAHMEDRKTNVEFMAFLKYLRSLYPAFVLLFIILDNASAHTMDRILDYASKHKIEFALTPTNTSWLNPIEPHFGPLRKFALSNFNPMNHKEISRNVLRCIAWMNRHHTATPPARRARKISGHDEPHLFGKCGVEILERH